MSVSSNKHAFREYEIIKKFEAGIVLKGSEAKSISLYGININETYVSIDKRNEVFLEGSHIRSYQNALYNNHLETAKRKLLLNKNEILELVKGVEAKGMTIVALKVFRKGHRYKLEIALARGKKLHDKRESLKLKTANKEAQIALKGKNR